MNILKISAIIGLCLIFSLPACKKGEDDPGLSFKSRNARITGEWELKSSNEITETNFTRTNLEDNTILTEITHESVVFDGTKYTYGIHLTSNNTVLIDTLIPDTVLYSYIYHFMENGDFNIEEVRTYPNGSVRYFNSHGKWSWGNNTTKKIAVDIDLSDKVLHFIIPELSKENLRLENESEFSEKYKRDKPHAQADDFHEFRTIKTEQLKVLKKR